MTTIALTPIARGEAKSYTFSISNANGTPMDLAGKKIVATLRLVDVLTVEKKNTAAGGSDAQIEVTALGIAKVKFAPADTASMTPCKLDGDLWVYTGATDPVRVAKFRLPVDQAQTRTFP
jgi:hypothetical protein